MTAYLCLDCQFIGESDFHRATDKIDDGPAFTVVIKPCPNCGSEDLTEAALCIDCAHNSVDELATCDDYCWPCAEKNFEPEDMEIFRRDQVQPVTALVKETA